MKNISICAAGVLAAAWAMGCGQAFAGCGIAAAYTPGNQAAHGEHDKQAGIAAAHPSLPPGTRVIVRNQRTGRSIIVRITDRDQSLVGRLIDLSVAAMNALGIEAPAPVCLEVVSYGGGSRGYRRTTVHNPLVEAKKMQVRRSAQARRGRAPSASVHQSGRKRYAQVHRGSLSVRRSSRRHLAARG